MTTTARELGISPLAVQQITDYSELRFVDERIAFIKAHANALEPAAMEFVLRGRSAEARVALGQHNANSLWLFESAQQRRMRDVLDAIAAETTSAEVSQLIFDYDTADPWCPYSFTQHKQHVISAHKNDRKFIKAASAHNDGYVRELAAAHLDKKSVMLKLKNRQYDARELRVFIGRFPDSDEVATALFSSPFHNGDEFLSNAVHLANKTTNRTTIKKLAKVYSYNTDPAASIARRFANDPEIAQLLIDNYRQVPELLTLANSTRDPQILDQVRSIYLSGDSLAYTDREFLPKELAKRFPNDVEIATRARDNEMAAETMADATDSMEVLEVLVSGSAARNDHSVRSAIRYRARDLGASLDDAVEDARLSGLESQGYPTMRSMADPRSLEAVLQAIGSDDTALAEAGRNALRALSASQSAESPAADVHIAAPESGLSLQL